VLWPLTKNHHSALSTFATRQNLHVFTITTNLDLSILHSEKTSFTTGSRSYRLWWHFDAFQSALHNNTLEAYSLWHLGPCKSISAERLTLTSQLPHAKQLSPSTRQSRSASPTINVARPCLACLIKHQTDIVCHRVARHRVHCPSTFANMREVSVRLFLSQGRLTDICLEPEDPSTRRPSHRKEVRRLQFQL